MRDLTPLCELAIKYSTDKGGRHNTYAYQPCEGTHEYTPIYWDLLNAQREQVRAVFEIGINAGGSLRLWAEFFPNAQIVGIDINSNYLFQTPYIASFLCDAADPHAIANVMQKVRHWRDFSQVTKYDLIVDDGSHDLGHQCIAVQTMPQYLSDIGVMVVEDIPFYEDNKKVLAANVPDGYDYGFIQPEPGTLKRSAPELLMIITRSAP